MEYVEIDLKGFLLEGTFGNIELGMPKSYVEELIGEPDYWMIAQIERNQKDDSPIWRYGNIEFQFNLSNFLVAIYNDHLANGAIHGGPKIRLNTWFLKEKNMRLSKVREYLDKSETNYMIEHILELEAQKTILKIESGVCLWFADEDEEYRDIDSADDYILYGFERRGDNPAIADQFGQLSLPF